MSEIEVTKTIVAGMGGSKKLKDIFGKDLVAVRYRVDRKRKMRYKTIELIVSRKSYATSKTEEIGHQNPV